MSSHGTSLRETDVRDVKHTILTIPLTKLHRIVLRQVLQVACLHSHEIFYLSDNCKLPICGPKIDETGAIVLT